MFRTPLLEGVFDRLRGGDAIPGRYEEMVAVGRIKKPEEAAEVVLCLYSGAASTLMATP